MDINNLLSALRNSFWVISRIIYVSPGSELKLEEFLSSGDSFSKFLSLISFLETSFLLEALFFDEMWRGGDDLGILVLRPPFALKTIF